MSSCASINVSNTSYKICILCYAKKECSHEISMFTFTKIVFFPGFPNFGTRPNGPKIPPGFPHYWVDRVTTSTWSFLSSGNISGNLCKISKVLQRLLKHFNGTAISTVLVLALESSFPVIIVFNWNDSESVVLYGSSLWYCHKLPDFSHPFIKIFSMLYLHIIYFPDEVNNLWTIF